ncbi:MAG: efflux RND transporter periplasmic adaptor subunit [Cognatishimia sp.]
MNLRPLLIVPPIAIGLLGFFWMTQPDENVQADIKAEPLAVRVMTATPEAVVITATGYGLIKAESTWTAVSQIDGRITSTLEGLAEGTIVQKGDLITQVDQTDFEIAIQKTEANISAAEATLNELARQQKNTQRLLELETRVLEVASSEFARVKDLVDRGASTQASLDTSQKALLAQESSVINLQNTLDLFPAQSASAQATLAVRLAELEEAKRALAETTVVAPFRGRVSSTSIESGQFIRTGEQLVEIEGIETFEVVAAFQPSALRPLVIGSNAFDPTEPIALDVTQVTKFFDNAGITAKVRLDAGGYISEYDARIARVRGTIDGQTGTLGIVVQVDDPLVADDITNRAPLNVGSFVSVDLITPELQNTLTVPRSVVGLSDDGQPFLFLSDADEKLRFKPVELGPVIGSRVVVLSGLNEGDKVVVSTPRVPIDGLPLTNISVNEDN